MPLNCIIICLITAATSTDEPSSPLSDGTASVPPGEKDWFSPGGEIIFFSYFSGYFAVYVMLCDGAVIAT
jgi:hypothetical protein